MTVKNSSISSTSSSTNSGSSIIIHKSQQQQHETCSTASLHCITCASQSNWHTVSSHAQQTDERGQRLLHAAVHTFATTLATMVGEGTTMAHLIIVMRELQHLAIRDVDAVPVTAQ
jgi:hypothetical protein